MAEEADNTTFARWNSAIEVLHNLNMQLAAAPDSERDALELAVAEVEWQVLQLEAPHLRAVLGKLRMLFDLDLLKPDQDGAIKRQLVEDFAVLTGIEPRTALDA